MREVPLFGSHGQQQKDGSMPQDTNIQEQSRGLMVW
jgi:hypothetical protein